MSYNLQDFVIRIIEVKGGIVDSKKENRKSIDALFPPQLQKKLCLEEYETLSFSPDEPGKLITYGSPLLDDILSLSEDIGLTTAVAVNDVSLKKEGIPELIDEKFQFINVKNLGHTFSERVTCSYLVVNFRVSIISDERKEDLTSIMVDEQTLRTFQDTRFPFSFPFSFQEKEPVDILEVYCLPEVIERAKQKATARIRENLKEFMKSHVRRMRRDIERLGNYYEDLKEELKRREQRKSLSPEEKESIPGKIKAVDMEFQRKKEDLKDRYSLKVSLSPFSACRIYLPKVVTRYDVQRKSQEKSILFFWNPLLKEREPIEPLVCDACGEETYGVFLCDQLHTLCPHCHFSCPGCGKKICKKCFPQHCPACKNKW
ncbi:hypothetical protein IBX65_02495 [Candidatus Aerophobetes bacterium]|nr:hypothetical protein [Candidatus Aerophobetes bacterium]